MNNPAFDDELATEYEAPGHTAPLDSALRPMPMALMPSVGVFGQCWGLREHTFELQSIRNTIENLRAERDDALRRLDVANDGD